MTANIKKLIPLFDKVLVEKAAPRTKTSGGIYLPDSAQIKENWGTVIEVGQGRKTEGGKLLPLVVKKGDKVMLNSWGGQTVNVNGKDLLVVKEEEILGVVEFDNNKN